MPPIPGMGKNHMIHHVHIADGFADDCEELIHRWLKTDTLTYETFCEIWKDLQFNFVYHGRPSGAEMAELSEELLQIAKHYMVSNTDNIEESIAGLFMVYALLRLQPYKGFAALRVVPEDVTALARIETVARREKRYDVLYILASTLIEGPVQYHAANRERGMDTSIRKYLEGTRGIDRLGVRPKGVFYRQNEESDLLRELNSITKRYQEAKRAIKGHNKELNYTNENLVTELDTSLKEIINGIIDDGPEAAKKMQDHYSKVQRIKEKAMKQAVEGVRHLATVGDGPSTSPLNRIQSEIRDRGKGSGQKRSPKGLTQYGRNRRHASDSDDDRSLTEESEEITDDDDEDPGTSSRPVELAKHLNLEEFHKESDQVKTNPKEKESVLDIEIESLPVFIRTEQDGKMFEIEVIDELNKWKSVQKIKIDAAAKLKQLTDVSLEKVDQTSEVNLSDVESQQDKQSDTCDPLSENAPSGSKSAASGSKSAASGSKAKASGSKMEASGSKMEEASGSKTKASGSKMEASGSKMEEASGSKTKASGSKMEEASGSKTKASGSKMEASGSKMEASSSKMGASRVKIEASSSKMGASGVKMEASGSKMEASGPKMEASGSQTEASGSQMEAGGSKQSEKVKRKTGRKKNETEPTPPNPEGEELVENMMLKKKELKDLKKTSLRNKLKRLGMLDMADLDDSSSSKKQKN